MYEVNHYKSLAFLMIVFFTPTYVAANSVDDMCLQSKYPKTICECATEKLKSTVDADDYALYEAIGQKYITGLSQGKGYAEAWDAASNEVASSLGTTYSVTLPKTNKIGKLHRAAMKSCK